MSIVKPRKERKYMGRIKFNSHVGPTVKLVHKPLIVQESKPPRQEDPES